MSNASVVSVSQEEKGEDAESSRGRDLQESLARML